MPYFENVDSPIRYFLSFNSLDNTYDIRLYNTATSEWRTASYPDSSTYIDWYAGTTELYYYEPPPEFRTDTTIVDWYTRLGTTYWEPADAFYFSQYGSEYSYVDIYAYLDEYYKYNTIHWSSQVP
jgi:hypothetical protein